MVIQWLMDRYRVSERRGCAAMRFDRSTHRDRPIRDEQEPLRKRMKEIALVRVRYGDRGALIVWLSTTPAVALAR